MNMLDNSLDDSYEVSLKLILSEFDKNLIFTRSRLHAVSKITVHDVSFKAYFVDHSKPLNLHLFFNLLSFFGYTIKVQSLNKSEVITVENYKEYFQNLFSKYRKMYLYDNNIVSKNIYEALMYTTRRAKTDRMFINLQDFLQILYKLDLQLLYVKQI